MVAAQDFGLVAFALSLIAKCARHVRHVRIARRDHPAFAGGDRLGGVEREAGGAYCSDPLAFPSGTECLAGVFDRDKPVTFG